jgi:hypothetical protein
LVFVGAATWWFLSRPKHVAAEPLPSYGTIMRECPGVRRYPEGGIFAQADTALGDDTKDLNCLLKAARVPDSVKSGINAAIEKNKDVEGKVTARGRVYD